MCKLHAIAAIILIHMLAVPAHANVFQMEKGLTSLETVFVGDAGNAPDRPYSGMSHGAVAYPYILGKYEVTAAQYTEFLNAVAQTDTCGLYNENMTSDSGCNIERTGEPGSYIYSVGPDWANRPVNYVSFWDACRFINWLHNGQPAGLQDSSTTEDGAYKLDGYTGGGGHAIARNPGAKWFLPSEDEWYKAAYYKGGGTDAGYWGYATKSDLIPSSILGSPTDPGNNATYHYFGYTIGSPYYRTEVGAHENSEGPYGTFDQAGNVWEWTETVHTYPYAVCRVMRGSSFFNNVLPYQLHASNRGTRVPSDENRCLGFRVAKAAAGPAICAE